jgi:hypothetical protein
MEFETIEQLVEQRRGYKYLWKDNTSPHQDFKYVFRKGKVFKTDNLDTNKDNSCGSGWDLATLDWILRNSNHLLYQKIVEFSIPEEAQIIVPFDGDGKFRTDMMRYEKQHKVEDLFPKLKKIKEQLKKYKPTNPIQATKLPQTKKIKKLLAQVGNQAWNQVGNQVGSQ